jgi:arginyl-tRNA synthetase
LNYYLLQVTPTKDITFDPAASISFTGDTGPYLQYTGARICSILRKYRERSAGPVGQFRGELLTGPEWQMVKTIASYPEWVYQAAKELNPSIVAGALSELARFFNSYYHEQPVLHNDDQNLVRSRIELIKAVKTVLQNGLFLLGIPFLERM